MRWLQGNNLSLSRDGKRAARNGPGSYDPSGGAQNCSGPVIKLEKESAEKLGPELEDLVLSCQKNEGYLSYDEPVELRDQSKVFDS